MNKFTKLEIKLKNLNVEPLRIARFFYLKGIVSHLVIQKLVYFSFLEGLKNDLLLFSETFQAWKYGPVLRSVFDEMTNCSDLDVMFAQVSALRRSEVIQLLENAYQSNKSLSTWDLVDKSHYGPWQKARDNLPTEETSTQEIELKELFNFAKTKK